MLNIASVPKEQQTQILVARERRGASHSKDLDLYSVPHVMPRTSNTPRTSAHLGASGHPEDGPSTWTKTPSRGVQHSDIPFVMAGISD